MNKAQLVTGAILGILGIAAALVLNHSGDPDLERLGLTLLLGLAVGALFQRSRFCMFCLFRDGWRHSHWSPFLGLLVAIAVGSLGYTLIFGAWVPDPSAGYLPPNAFIGPVGWHLVVGGLLFGIGMGLSGSCISSHLYRTGEGNSGSLFSLIFVLPGFLLGYLSWDFWYANSIRDAPVVWLPAVVGYSGALTLQLALIALLSALALSRNHDPIKSYIQLGDGRAAWKQWAFGRWPVLLSSLILGLIAVGFYLRLRPLGVTSEISRLGRDLGAALGLLPTVIPGIDKVRGCTPQEAAGLLTENAVLLFALTGGSLTTTLLASRFRIQVPDIRQLPLLALGGLLLGYGAFISLGCNIGTFLSGTMALSLSGWVFGLFMALGIFGVLRLGNNSPLIKGCSVPLISLHQVPNLRRQEPASSPPGYIPPWDLWKSIRRRDEGLLILETGRNPDSFEAGHIPNALWFDFREVFQPARYSSGLYPASFARLAPDPSQRKRPVVVYDVVGAFRAARLALALIMAGWTRVRVLDGAFQGWVGVGFPAERGWNRLTLPFSRTPVPPPQTQVRIVTARDILDRPSTEQVWDNRPTEEYRGEFLKSRYPGTIPGSRHFPWTNLYRAGKVFLKHEPDLRQLFQETMGEEPVTGIDVFCQTGERSSLVAWTALHLYPNLSIGLYDASWEEWGNSENLPRRPAR